MVSSLVTGGVRRDVSDSAGAVYRLGFWLVAALGLIAIAISADAQVFGPPGVLSNTVAASDFGDDHEVQFTTDGAGNWVAVCGSDETFGDQFNRDWDILVAHSNDNGASWSVPRFLNTNASSDTGDDRMPQLSTDGAGNWVAVWYAVEVVAEIVTDTRVLVARSINNGATWSSPAPLNVDDIPGDFNRDWVPEVTNDGNGNWVALWYLSQADGMSATDLDVMVSRSSDNGASWSSPVPLNTDAATDSEARLPGEGE